MAYKTKKREPLPGAGRPSKFKDEYCDMLIEHMSKGLSFDCFAGEVKVSIPTLYEWVNAYPEFSDAKSRGKALSMAFWEKAGIEGLWHGGGNERDRNPTFNSTVWVFSMKNRFGWRDRSEEHQQVITPIVLSYDPNKKKEDE